MHFLWHELSHVPYYFYLVTLILKFDLLLKNFNLCCYWVVVPAQQASLSSDNHYYKLNECLKDSTQILKFCPQARLFDFKRTSSRGSRALWKSHITFLSVCSSVVCLSTIHMIAFLSRTASLIVINLGTKMYGWSTSVDIFRRDPSRGQSRVGKSMFSENVLSWEGCSKNQVHISDLKACRKKCSLF